VADHAYMRASTAKQEASPEVQREQLKAYCLARGWGEPMFYLDKATTSKIPLLERTAGAQLNTAIRAGDRVIFTKMDRGFRNLKEFLVVMDDWSGRIGVTVHIINFMGGNAIDFSSPVGKLCVQMLAAVAEFERATIAERTKETMRHLRAQGNEPGQPRFGFKYIRVQVGEKTRRRAIPDPEERKQMREILRLRTETPPYSWDEIRVELNYTRKWHRTKKWGAIKKNREWSLSAIQRACKAELILQYREALSHRGGEEVREHETDQNAS